MYIEIIFSYLSEYLLFKKLVQTYKKNILLFKIFLNKTVFSFRSLGVKEFRSLVNKIPVRNPLM